MMLTDDYEIWVYKKPVMADHIKTPRAGNLYTHHGIYVSDEEVIHFASENSDNLGGIGNEIISTNLTTFLKGGELLVRGYTEEEKKLVLEPDHIVTYARSCIGEGGYNLVFNNCEHFCNKCIFDEHRSKQVERVIKVPQEGGDKMSILDKIGSLLGKVTTTKRIIEEPSKVEIAEIERQKAIQLAEIDKEKILLSSECEAKLNEFNTKLAIALMQSQSEQFTKVNEKMLEIGKKAQAIEIERSSIYDSYTIEVQYKLDELYNKQMQTIADLQVDFFENRYPRLQKSLEQYENNPDAKKIAVKSLTLYLENFLSRIDNEMGTISETRKLITASSIKSKEKILEDSTKFAQERMGMMKEILDNSVNINTLLDKRETKNQKLINNSNNKQIALSNQEQNELPQIETRTNKD